jgi:hypothetical protein
MDLDEILKLSRSCMDVLEVGGGNPTFEASLARFSGRLLSMTAKDAAVVHVDENFEALIMYMAKVVVVPMENMRPSVFVELFRAILALELHYYSSAYDKFTKFITDWSVPFAWRYTNSLIANFYLAQSSRSPSSGFGMLTLFLMIYFSDDYRNNPFSQAIGELSESIYPSVIEAIRANIRHSVTVILLYSLLMFSEKFSSFCVSCVDVQWVSFLANEIPNSPPQLADLRLTLLLMLSHDLQLSNAISTQSKLFWEIFPILLNFVNSHCLDESRHSSVVTAISVMLNLSRRVSEFDQRKADLFFLTMKKCLQSDRCAEHLRLMTLFIELTCMKRARWNLSLLYSLLRNANMMEKLTKVVEKSENSEGFSKSLKNLNVIVSSIMERVKGKDSAEGTMRSLRDTVENWFPTALLENEEYPVFRFVSHEFHESVKFFRDLLLKEIQRVI